MTGRAPEAAGPFPGDAPAIPWSRGAASGGRLTWTGVAGFCFAYEGVAIAIDPFVTRPSALRVVFRRPPPARALVRERFRGLAAVFVGHAHYDHTMDLPAVAEASPDALFYGGPATLAFCRTLGVPAARLRPTEDGERVAVGPFAVEAVRADHGKVPLVHLFDREVHRGTRPPRTLLRFPRGEVLAWRVEAGGRRFHVQGSAGIHDASLARQERADALLACLAARRDTPDYLRRLGAVLAPDVVVPCHHDDLFRPLATPIRPVPFLDWEGFLRDAGALEAAHGTRLWRPPRGVPAAW